LIDALRLLFALILYFIILFFDSHKLTIPLRVFFENSKRQKLIGLRSKASPGLPADSVTIADLVLKKNEINKVILIGTPEEVLEEFLKSSKEFTSKDDVVFNDLDYDYLPISDENFVRDLEERKRRLEQVIAKTEIRIINELRPGKKLLVLDLDHTLFDFSSRHGVLFSLTETTRPGLEEFLVSFHPQIRKATHIPINIILTCTAIYLSHSFFAKTTCYQFYDIVIWSQTSWDWLEVKLTELGMLTHPKYRIAFVLDKTAMFKVKTFQKDGRVVEHYVKPLPLIWAKLPIFSAKNTIHIDDLKSNFAMNPQNGLRITPYHYSLKERQADRELYDLAQYLSLITRLPDFTCLNHANWREYLREHKNELGSSQQT
jgi:ubiquitin-like domain-containing CTD phosphatase 1